MYSNGNRFGSVTAIDLGGGQSYQPGQHTGDGSRPASRTWLFAVLTWRI